MPASGLETSELLFFMDKVFDSVNGAAVTSRHGKPLRCAVSTTTSHSDFWTEAIKVFESMEFFNEKRNKFIPPTVKNWLHTLKALKYLWHSLRNKGFRFLCVRHLNQDPLENYFGQIRSHGVRNVNPTCQSFMHSYKSLLISNFSQWHSPSANCEDDNTEMLNNFQEMFKAPQLSLEVTPLQELEDFVVNIPTTLNYTVPKTGTMAYIAGYIARKMLKYTKNCTNCKNVLLGDVAALSEAQGFIIESRSYNSNLLTTPNTNFNKIFCQCIHVMQHSLPKICYKYNVSKTVQHILKLNVDFQGFNCQEHNVTDRFVLQLTEFYIFTYIKNVNRILKGKIIPKSSNDSIKTFAINYVRKHRKHIGNYAQ